MPTDSSQNSSRIFDVKPIKDRQELFNELWQGSSGSLAAALVPQNDLSGDINVVKDYEWTTTNNQTIRDQVPRVILTEYAINEGMFFRQLLSYAQRAIQFSQNLIRLENNPLFPYEGLFPKNSPTKWKYTFPYFSETAFRLQTQEWSQLGSLSEQIKHSLEGASDIERRLNKDGKASYTETGKSFIDFLTSAGEFAAQASFSVTGVNDRPRIFSNHYNNTISINFFLFNTTKPREWEKNRDLLFLFINQNLYNKRDFGTGLPPVFYEVYVPGQYFSVASTVTSINVKNEGNVREMVHSRTGKRVVVPDAYNISIDLVEMAMPSRNQFQAIEMSENEKITYTESK